MDAWSLVWFFAQTLYSLEDYYLQLTKLPTKCTRQLWLSYYCNYYYIRPKVKNTTGKLLFVTDKNLQKKIINLSHSFFSPWEGENLKLWKMPSTTTKRIYKSMYKFIYNWCHVLFKSSAIPKAMEVFGQASGALGNNVLW